MTEQKNIELTTATTNTEKINFLELGSDLFYLQHDLLNGINEKALSKHLPPSSLIKLGLLSDDCSLPDNFACLGVIPSIRKDGEVRVTKPCLFSKDGEIWLYDSKLQPYKQITSDNILDWVVGSGGYATILLDDVELTVATSSNKSYLTSRINLNNLKDGELIADYLSIPIKPCIPLKSRIFEVGNTYEVIKVHENERGSYYESENDVYVETGLLIDIKIDDKNTVKNVICNSQLERMIIQGNLPLKFKIVDKKEISKGKIKVILLDANKTAKKVNLDDLDLI